MFIGKLSPTQKEAATLMANRKRFLLAWEEGTGKTVIAIAVIAKLLELGLVQSVLIVVPSHIAWQWEERFQDFAPALEVERVSRKHGRDYNSSAPVTIVSYTLFRRDFDTIVTQRWDVWIADECQEFSNVRSKTSKLFKRLNREMQPTYRFALSGTAISNKLEELYNIVYCLDTRFLPPWPVFEKRHIVRNKFKVIAKYKNLISLHEYLKNIMHRRTHADLKGEIPEIRIQTHTVEPNSDYLALQGDLLRVLDDYVGNLEFDSEGEIKPGRGRAKVSKAFSKVRQALQSDEKLKYSVKLIQEILEASPENRIVVFNHYKEPLYKLRDSLREAGISTTSFTGDEDEEEKRESVQTFRSSNTVRVLLCSNAGATGLDLPFANHLIHLDVPFSYGLLSQRTKRITRKGSKFESVVIHYLVLDDSIELFYLTQVKNKERLAKAVSEGTEDEVTMRPESLREFISARA